MKKLNMVLMAGGILSTVTLIILVIFRVNSPIKADFRPDNQNWLSRYESYVQYSNDRWNHRSISLANSSWTYFTTNTLKYDYYCEISAKYVQTSSDHLPLSDLQIGCLNRTVVEFFRAYSDGSYESFLRFHQGSPYSIGLTDFIDDDLFTNWVSKFKKPFASPDEQLRTIWEFPLFQNARGIWCMEKIKADQASGKTVSYNLDSSYTDDLYREFEDSLMAGEVDVPNSLRITGISPKDYQVRILKSTNGVISLSNFINPIIRGTQFGGHHVFLYNSNPETIIRKQGYCIFAIVTASVSVSSCNCYVVIAPSFYWSSDRNAWLPFKMGRFSKGGYNVIF